MTIVSVHEGSYTMGFEANRAGLSYAAKIAALFATRGLMPEVKRVERKIKNPLNKGPFSDWCPSEFQVIVPDEEEAKAKAILADADDDWSLSLVDSMSEVLENLGIYCYGSIEGKAFVAWYGVFNHSHSTTDVYHAYAAFDLGGKVWERYRSSIMHPNFRHGIGVSGYFNQDLTAIGDNEWSEDAWRKYRQIFPEPA